MVEEEKLPEGHFINQWTAIGIALGAGLGVPIGLVIGNPGLFGIGLPVGLAVGVAVGTSLENKAKKQGRIRPLTPEEERRKRTGVHIMVGLLVMGLLTAALFYFMVK